MAKRKTRNTPSLTPGKAYIAPARTDVDVVIPVYGKFDLLEKCLDSLPKAMGSLNWQVYMVDNASTEKELMLETTRKIKAKFGAKVTPFMLDQNRGFPTACNFGADRGRSPYIIFVNTDIVMEPGSIQTLMNTIDNDPHVAAVGPKLLFPENTPHGPAGKIQHAGLDMNIRGEVQHSFIGWSADHPKANIRCAPFALTGAVMMVRRKFFRDAGGFFEGYGLGTWEDVDLCVTARKMGYNILYEPNAVGYHFVGASAVAYKVQYPMNLNRQIFMMRHQQDVYWSEWERL